MILKSLAFVFLCQFLGACGVIGGGSSGKSQSDSNSILGNQSTESYALEVPVNGSYYINSTRVPVQLKYGLFKKRMAIGEEIFEEPLNSVQNVLYLSTHEITCSQTKGEGGTTLAVVFNEFDLASEILHSSSRVRTDNSFENGHVSEEHFTKLTNVGSFVVTGSIESYGLGFEFFGDFVVKVCP